MNGIGVVSVGNLEVVGSGVRSGKRRLFLCKELENEGPVPLIIFMYFKEINILD